MYSMKDYIVSIITAVILVLAGGGWYWYTAQNPNTPIAMEEAPATEETAQASSTPNENNAPVNSGDTDKGAGVEQDLATIATENIIDKWHNSTDTKLFREFKTNNVFIDSRDGVAIASGSWRVFTGDDAVSVPFELQPGRVYIKMTLAGETMYIKVANLTLTNLQLVFMDRPGMLFYSRAE